MTADATPSPAASRHPLPSRERGLDLRVELGRQWVDAADVAHLAAGSVIELQSPSSSEVVVRADGRQVAGGQLVVVDGKLGVKVTRLM